MIFATHAPRYWQAGLPVIPLEGKKPMPLRWTAYADQLPDEATRADWLRSHPNANIGLPLGPQSGLVALDVDSDDPRVLRVIQEYLPASLWRRVGKKGFVLAFRYSGQRTWRIKTHGEQMLCELLSKGAQVVLPPSIHPDTQAPYQANRELLDVVGDLAPLPTDLEAILRGAFEREGFDISINGWTKISTFVPAGARDNAMVAHAGILARAVIRGERSLLEALNELEHWVLNFTEKVAGDDINPQKAKERLIQFIARDVLGEKKRTLPIGWDEGLTEADKEKLGLTVVEDRVQWSSEQIQTYLIAECSRHEPGSPGQLAAVDQALGRMVGNDAINSLEVDRLLRWMAESTGRAVTIGALKKRLQELQRGEIAGLDHTEIAKAVLKEMNQYGQIRFHNAQFWQWKGACWETMTEHAILAYVAEEYGHLPAGRRNADHRGILATMRALSAGDLKTISLSAINFANGVLLEDLTMRPHAPDYGMTYVLPYRYLPEEAGKCPKWFHFLRDVWGREEDYEDRVLALQEAMAATMFGVAPVYQRAICLFGVPHTGKSRVMNVMAGLMPEEAKSTCSPIHWHDRFAPATMAGKLLNQCGELPDTGYIEGSMFKMIVEGDVISGQFKGKDIFQFRPLCAHWFSTNHLPRSRDSSGGFVRRWLFLEFSRKITEEEKVIGIDNQILADEREAVAAWAVAGLARLVRQQEYTLPRSHKRLADDVANSNNSVRFFLSTSGKVRVGPLAHQGSSENSTTETTLHNTYWTFCGAMGGVSPVGTRSFRQRMRELKDEFGFDLKIRMTPLGNEFAEYEYITLVR